MAVLPPISFCVPMQSRPVDQGMGRVYIECSSHKLQLRRERIGGGGGIIDGTKETTHIRFIPDLDERNEQRGRPADMSSEADWAHDHG